MNELLNLTSGMGDFVIIVMAQRWNVRQNYIDVLLTTEEA